MIIRNGHAERDTLLTASKLRACKADQYSVTAIVDGLTPKGDPATYVVVLTMNEIDHLHRIAHAEPAPAPTRPSPRASR